MRPSHPGAPETPPGATGSRILKHLLCTVLVLAPLIVAGCAPDANPPAGTTGGTGVPAGFWLGLWHGFILLFTFIISLFNDGVGIYAAHNNGHLYDLGYLLGVMAFFGGSGGGARKRRGQR
ncbi:MAG: hypothetical protein PVF43_01105 [Candidatus Eiseniibacteriota bacterium]|jgi:hypothetical protein